MFFRYSIVTIVLYIAAIAALQLFISHLMGTTRIGITRACALSSVLPLPRTLQSWDLGLLIPTVPHSSYNLFVDSNGMLHDI